MKVGSAYFNIYFVSNNYKKKTFKRTLIKIHFKFLALFLVIMKFYVIKLAPLIQAIFVKNFSKELFWGSDIFLIFVTFVVLNLNLRFVNTVSRCILEKAEHII